jgi:hypothetical protein
MGKHRGETFGSKAYQITYLINSDYCSLNPSDTECQRKETIYADNKTKAILEFHQLMGMSRSASTRCGEGKTLPEVWSIDELSTD